MSILEGSDPLEKLRKGYLTAYKANLLLWPWVQAVNFTFVPLEHRVLVVNIVSVGESKHFPPQFRLIVWHMPPSGVRTDKRMLIQHGIVS
jgi:hypothetical protein